MRKILFVTILITSVSFGMSINECKQKSEMWYTYNKIAQKEFSVNLNLDKATHAMKLSVAEAQEMVDKCPDKYWDNLYPEDNKTGKFGKMI